MLPVIYNFADADFSLTGKNHYQIAFHLDGSWGYSLLPLTVINGKRGSNSTGVICFGGTHGNEYEGQVAVKRLCAYFDPDPDQRTHSPASAIEPQRLHGKLADVSA